MTIGINLPSDKLHSTPPSILRSKLESSLTISPSNVYSSPKIAPSQFPSPRGTPVQSRVKNSRRKALFFREKSATASVDPDICSRLTSPNIYWLAVIRMGGAGSDYEVSQKGYVRSLHWVLFFYYYYHLLAVMRCVAGETNG